jgi:glycosyltransferase involved in cell wall biosynthesis
LAQVEGHGSWHGIVNTAAPALPRVLLVDTLSSGNDFGVDLPIALDPLVNLTVFTIKGTRLRAGDCARLIVAFPEYWGGRSKIAKFFDQLRASLRLAAEVWRHRRGAVHVQFFRSIAFELPLYALMRPFVRRIVCTVHNVLPHERRWWHPWLYRWWYRRLDCLHVMSKHTAERLVREFDVAPAAVLTTPHGNYERFRRDHPPAQASLTRRRLGLAAADCLVLYFGLIRPYKGVERLIDAAPRIQDQRVKLMIAGNCTPDIEKQLRLRIDAAASGAHVDFRPSHLANQEMSDLIAAADVVVFPYHHIYQSGALLLALTYGKAVIASDLQGFREYIEPGVTGVLCDTADPDQFGGAIERLAGDPDARTRLEAQATNASRDRFAWPVVARALVAAYQD